MNTPNRVTGGIPVQQIETISGLVTVLQFVDAIRGKVWVPLLMTYGSPVHGSELEVHKNAYPIQFLSCLHGSEPDPVCQ